MTRTPPDALIELDALEAESAGGSRWAIGLTLNLLLVLLGTSAVTIAFQSLDSYDARTLYNPWTYVVLIPLVLVIISKLLSTVASRLVERSMQAAFLSSLLIHLLLLTSAGNIVIFSQAWPELFDSLTEQRQRLERLQALQAPQYAEHFFHPKENLRPDYLRPAPTPDIQEQTVMASPDRSRLAAELDSEPIQEMIPSAATLASGPTEASRRNVMEQLQRRLASSEPEPMLTAEGDMGDVDIKRTAGGRPGQPARPSLPQMGPTIVESPQMDVQPRSAAITRTRPDSPLPEMDSSASPLVAEVASMRSKTWDRSVRITPGVLEESSGQGNFLDDDGNAALLDPAGLTGSEGNIEKALLGATAAAESNSSLSITRLPSSPPEVSTAVNSVGQTADLPIDSKPLESESGISSRDEIMADRTSLERRSSRRQGEPNDLASSVITDLPPAPISDAQQPTVRRGSNETAAEGLAGAKAWPSKTPVRSSPTELLPDLELEVPSSTGLSRRELEIRSAPAVVNGTAQPAFQQRLDRLRNELAPSSSEDSASRQPTAIDLAIERGLEFLARHQRSDGSWRLQDFDSEVLIRSDTAATGLALLAFQGAGYTHLQSKFAPQVNRAIRFLVENQQEDGDLYIPQDPASDQNAWLYSHSIAALALCEAFGMTQDERLRPAAQRAVDFMVNSQDRRRGGWRYRPGTGADTSVTGWFALALKSGQLAGLEIPREIYSSIQQYMDDAQASYSAPHLYRYNPFAPDTDQQRHGLRPTAVMTSVGLISRLYLGWDPNSPEIKRGAEFLLEHPPEHGTRRQSLRDTYYWYYATQVIYQVGGQPWQRWQTQLYPLLIEHQETTGEYAGSWSPEHPVPDLWSRYGGRLYVTTMNLLSLEVSYRHLPLYESASGD